MVINRGKNSGLRDLLSIDKPWSEYRIVWTDPTGQYDMVAVETQWDYGLEGYFLAHCLGTKDFEEFNEDHVVYSLRDSRRIPHATALCIRDGKRSLYGQSTDLGTMAPFRPEPGLDARVLQVRGREDKLAALPYHRLVRDWYIASGGELMLDPKRLDAWCTRSAFSDFDWQYHCDFLLDESVNFFGWANHNERLREAYKPH